MKLIIKKFNCYIKNLYHDKFLYIIKIKNLYYLYY